MLVPPLERQEVGDVQHGAGQGVSHPGRAEVVGSKEEQGDGERGEEGRRDGPVEPDEDGPAAHPLGQQVPRGVEDGGDEDEQEGRCRHVASGTGGGRLGAGPR